MQIIAILKEAEGGAKVGESVREHGISAQAIHRWRAKYGGTYVGEARCLNELEDENWRLKQMVADLWLDKEALKSALGNEW